MARPLPVSVPPSSDLETLRKHVVVNLNNLSLRIAQQDNRTAPMSMGGNRLTDVPDPANALDAVNLRTLKKALQGQSHPHQKQSSANHYTIVWSINGIATGTTTPYIVNPYRTGSPGVAKIYALNTGTANTGMAIWYVPGGTGTPAKLLTTDIILPLSKKGPISATGFVLQVPFAINDVLYAVVTTAGGASNLSLELLVNP